LQPADWQGSFGLVEQRFSHASDWEDRAVAAVQLKSSMVPAGKSCESEAMEVDTTAAT